jgi:hypothetical protein
MVALTLLMLFPAPAEPTIAGTFAIQWGDYHKQVTTFAPGGGCDSPQHGPGEWSAERDGDGWRVRWTERGVWYVMVIDADGNGSGAREEDSGAYSGVVVVRCVRMDRKRMPKGE